MPMMKDLYLKNSRCPREQLLVIIISWMELGDG